MVSGNGRKCKEKVRDDDGDGNGVACCGGSGVGGGRVSMGDWGAACADSTSTTGTYICTSNSCGCDRS